MARTVDERSLTSLLSKLEHFCSAHGTTQSALAMKLGISASHLNQIINGRVRPSPRLFEHMKEFLRAFPIRNRGIKIGVSLRDR